VNAASEQFAGQRQAATEGLIGVANAQFSMFEHLASLHLKATTNAYEDLINYFRAAANAKSPQDLFSLNVAAAQPAMEKAQAYAREVYEVVSISHGHFNKLFEAQTADMKNGFAGLLDQYSKGAPGGSDFAVAAIKSALAAANTVYDSFSKATKQTSDIAQANFAAAANVAKEVRHKAA
jgi:phasin family protein